MRRTFRRARIQLPARISLWLGMAGYLPSVITSADARRHFKEEAAIEAAVEAGKPLRRNGEGLSERVIEVPWVSRQLAELRPQRVLDTGTAHAPVAYHRMLYRLDATVHGADLVPFELPGVRSSVADLRELPFADASFDAAICVSTLEHIGMDNRVYFDSSGEAVDEEGDVVTLRQLGRVTRPGGRLLVTVPGGRDASFGWQRQYSPEHFREVAEAAGLAVEKLDLYAHDPGVGWRAVPPEDLRERTYGSGAVAAAAVICGVLVR